jgi:short-subunit dehydrogenase
MKAVITGASQGLGRALADHFISQGWEVVELSRSTGVDIRNLESVITACANIDDIDLLINNAAQFDMREFINSDVSNIDRIIDTNVKGTMYVTKACLHKMKKGSRIIFINSVAGIRHIENQSVYCASKTALTAFAGVLGQELRQRAIKVSSIHPGGINTTLWNNENPYPGGDSSNALDTQHIVNMVNMIVATGNVEYKTITMFPEIEWH